MRQGCFWAALGALFFAACDFEEAKRADPVDAVYPIAVGLAELDLEVVFRESERRRGLMFREHLPPNQGMLFVFENADRLSFWMRDTSIPLEIGFFDRNGVLRELHVLIPFDETPVVSRRDDLVLAVELNRGAWERKGIEPGDRMDMQAARYALVRRGGRPPEWWPER